MTAAADLAQAPAALTAPVLEPPVRRRARAPRGLLLQRAFDLRDELPTGRRRADTSSLRPTVQVIAGVAATGAGLAAYEIADASWNWLGALAACLGPAVFILGAMDLANRGEYADRRVARIFRTVRAVGVVFTTLVVLCGLALGITALGLLCAAVWRQWWSHTTEMLLINAILTALMGAALSLLVSVTDLPAVPLSRGTWWRELGTIKQLSNIAISVTVVGAAVALSLHDARAVVVAMIGFTMALLTWARAERASTDDRVRNLAAAADSLAAAVRPLVGSSPAGGPDPYGRHHKIIEALDALDLACYRAMRRGALTAGPRYLVDFELLAVIRACKSALPHGSLEQIPPPLAATVARDLLALNVTDLEHEILVLASDARRLAIRS